MEWSVIAPKSQQGPVIVAQVVVVVLAERIDLHARLGFEPLVLADQIVNDRAQGEAPLGVVRDPHDVRRAGVVWRKPNVRKVVRACGDLSDICQTGELMSLHPIFGRLRQITLASGRGTDASLQARESDNAAKR